MIDGVKILERYAFGDERGEVMHIMKRSDENFQKFIVLRLEKKSLKVGTIIKKRL